MKENNFTFENEIIETYLERTLPLMLLGECVTFRIPAILANIILFSVSVYLLFLPFYLESSLLILFVFIPIFFYLLFKFIVPSTSTLKSYSKLIFFDKKITIISGFPHSMQYDTKSVDNEDIKNILIKGDTLLGYFVEFSQFSVEAKEKEIGKITVAPVRYKKQAKAVKNIRFGLWQDAQEAENCGKIISNNLNKELINKLKLDGEINSDIQ